MLLFSTGKKPRISIFGFPYFRVLPPPHLVGNLRLPHNRPRHSRTLNISLLDLTSTGQDFTRLWQHGIWLILTCGNSSTGLDEPEKTFWHGSADWCWLMTSEYPELTPQSRHQTHNRLWKMHSAKFLTMASRTGHWKWDSRFWHFPIWHSQERLDIFPDLTFPRMDPQIMTIPEKWTLSWKRHYRTMTTTKCDPTRLWQH